MLPRHRPAGGPTGQRCRGLPRHSDGPRVDSAGGGAARARVITACPSLAPPDFALLLATPTTLTLRLRDNSTSGAGFKICGVTVGAGGPWRPACRPVRPASVPTAPWSPGHVRSPGHLLQVDSSNVSSAQRSPTLRVGALALPATTAGITDRFGLIATTGTVVTGIASRPSATASVTR